MPVLSRWVYIGPGVARNINYISGEYDYGYGSDGDPVRIAATEPFFPFMARVPKNQAPLDLGFLQGIEDWRNIVRILCERGFAPQYADVGWAQTLPEPSIDEYVRLNAQMHEIKGIFGQDNHTAVLLNNCEVQNGGVDFLILKRDNGSLFPVFLADIERVDLHWPANTVEFTFTDTDSYPDLRGSIKLTRRSLLTK